MLDFFRDLLTAMDVPNWMSVLASPLIIIAFGYAVLVSIGFALVRLKLIKIATLTFYLFISPWLVGFIVFSFFPIVYSFWLSLTSWDIVSEPQYVGFENYKKAFNDDPVFYKSLWVTVYYTFVSLPLQLICGFVIALLLNQKIAGISWYRTIYYLPSLVSGVAVAVLWGWIFNPNFGVLNNLLRMFGINGLNWLSDPTTAMPSLILMSLWGIGGGMVIYLAGLQDIPQSLYEAADLDGAGRWAKIRHITIPMMTPIIFFNLIMGIIGSFQTFTQAFVMTEGGPNNSTMFYVLKLYNHAFKYFEMGYASALAWILFVIILGFTAVVFKASAFWVYYEGEAAGKSKKRRAVHD